MKENLFKTVGEFEAQESVTLMWPLTRYATKTTEYDRDAASMEMVGNLLGNVEVIISCYNDEQKNYIINVLQENQIDTLSLNLYGGGIHCNTRNIPKAR
jgi:agmatine/peptidylarginine deiminase